MVQPAVDLLRAKGLATAAKKSSRTAAEGLVAVAVDGTKGTAVEINSQTDFVAKNEQFQDFVRKVAGVALGLEANDAETILAAAYPDGGSVHLLEWPEVPASDWIDADLAARWDGVRVQREAVTEAIEPFRREKTIRSSLEAEIAVPQPAFPIAELEEVFIVSAVREGDSLTVTRTANHKCGRCWRHLPDVAEDGALCGRCADVLG